MTQELISVIKGLIRNGATNEQIIHYSPSYITEDEIETIRKELKIKDNDQPKKHRHPKRNSSIN